jgi:enamine deaminase RidA (YjgF/YER057c/UK114 family)
MTFKRIGVLASTILVTGGATAPAMVHDIDYFTRPGSKSPFSMAVRNANTVYVSGQIGAA